MGRLYKLLSWFFFLLTPVLGTVAALAVPENAFADYPGCMAMCKALCADTSYPAGCETYCSAGCTDCDSCNVYTGDQYDWCMIGCDHFYDYCRASGCSGSATYNPCKVNDNDQNACKGICCANSPNPNGALPCTCQWTSGPPTSCNCPP